MSTAWTASPGKAIRSVILSEVEGSVQPAFPRPSTTPFLLLLSAFPSSPPLRALLPRGVPHKLAVWL